MADTFPLPTMESNSWSGLPPEPVHAARIARFFMGAGISASFGRRAETHLVKDQDYGVFAHRNPLLWLG